MKDSIAYPNSSSPFASFQNSVYHSTYSSPSLQMQTRDVYYQSTYSSLSNYNCSSFALGDADSPASPSKSVSLSNSDDSPIDSPVIMRGYLPGYHPSGFDYDYDMFGQRLNPMFAPPFTDYSCGSCSDSNNLFNITGEPRRPPLNDSYQPYMDASTKSIPPHEHQRTALLDIFEHLENNSETMPSLTYGFPDGYQNSSAASLSSQNLVDPNSSFYYVQATASRSPFTAMRLPVIPPQPCAQPTQLSPQCANVVEPSPSPHLFAAVDIPYPGVFDPRFVNDRGDNNAKVLQTEHGVQFGKYTSASSIHSSIAAQSLLSYNGGKDSFKPDDEHCQACLDNASISRFTTRSTRARSSYDPDDVHVSSTGIAATRPRGSNVPVPVPNLTKKSRGRNVPTVSLIAWQGVGKNPRSYMCKVKDCGKCFSRGEHLKRHIRSIHTNDKPHKCTFPGCGKVFSRRDNLGQHTRGHSSYEHPVEGQ